MSTKELRLDVEYVISAIKAWPRDEWPDESSDSVEAIARYVQRMLDPTPVDRAWWLSVAEAPTAFTNGVYAHGFESSVEFWAAGTTIANAKTRGQVRQLCSALEIELKEDA